MSTSVFIAVIGAAILHAAWNTLVKGGADKQLAMTAVVLGHVPLAVLMLFIVPLPSVESLPYIAGGIALHFGYQIFLLQSYHAGELTQVYPIARGTAPLLVAGVSVMFLGVELETPELIAILTIGTGILSMSLVRQNNGQRNTKAARLALMTGCFIAAYSLVDGNGARIANSALGFYGWVALGNASLMALYSELTSPGLLTKIPKRAKRVFVIGGSASFAAYGLVMWAFTQAPIAMVTALRETSIVFALFLGVFFLKERLDLAKVLSTFVTLLGAALLRFAK